MGGEFSEGFADGFLSCGLGVLGQSLGFGLIENIVFDGLGSGMSAFIEGKDFGEIMLTTIQGSVVGVLTVGPLNKIDNLSFVKKMKTNITKKINITDFKVKTSNETDIVEVKLIDKILSLDFEKLKLLSSDILDEAKIYFNDVDLLKEVSINEAKKVAISRVESSVSDAVKGITGLTYDWIENLFKNQGKESIAD